MEVKIRSRSGWLYAVVPRQRGGGPAVVKRLGTRDPAEARELIKLANLEQLALAAKADLLLRDVWVRLLAGRKVSVQKAAEAFEQNRYNLGNAPGYIRFMMAILDAFVQSADLAHQTIAAVESQHIADFVNQPGRNSLSYRTHQLAAIRVFLDFCVAQQWLSRNPAFDVAVRIDTLTQEQLIPQRRKAFTEGEVKTLLASIPETDFWHGAVLFGYHYGLRMGTVIAIEESNLTGNQLRIYARKNKRIVNEPLTDDLIAWLAVWRHHRPPSGTDYLFPAQMASGTDGVKNQFRRILERVGLNGRSFDGLRKLVAARTWNAALAELGDDKARKLAEMVMHHGLRRVQEILAHTPGSDVTAKHYLPEPAQH